MKDDLEELKAFVVNHPNNKMAWYFLGRAYAARGEQGKALYCFRQSGEIYHIYEQKELLPSEDEDSTSSEDFISLTEWEENSKSLNPPPSYPFSWTRSWDWPKLILSFILIMFVSLQAPGSWPLAPGYEAQERITSIQPIKEGEQKDIPESQWVIAIPKHADEWILWGKEPSWQMPELDSGSYSGESSGNMNESWNAWRMNQEEMWVMYAGLDQYKIRFGDHPGDVEELIQPYPDNILSGFTKAMRSAYKRDMPVDKGIQIEEELEIIVDKQNHRIGLVKGKLLIRNYPAGLGGDLTPEEEFKITEKVRNPNGRDDGEFGSRGMTLSDTLYAIHGTNEPDSIGEDESLGCIRMMKEDLEELFDMAPLGTKVTISRNVLPDELVIPNQRFSLPAETVETNHDKVYQWL